MGPPAGTTDLVDVGGRNVAVWSAGDAGPPVLLVHGIPTNSRLWWDVVPVVAQRARVFAVDMPGYGDSPAPEDQPVDLASQAALLLDLLDTLGLDRVVVVGHDLGGGIAQILAVTASDRVAGLGVVDGVSYDGWPVPMVRAMKAAWPLLERLPAEVLAAALRPGLRTLFAQQDRADPFLDRFLEPWRRPEGPRLLARHLRSLDSVYTQTVAPFLPRLQVPTEVVWGRRDHQMKPRYGERLAQDIPGARLTWVDDASHFVPADRPDVVAEAVLRLVERAAR
ncbi:alpha/beta fold hydrolase [Geodermatophilus obscurus]|uniref:Alpha/beta hydrolase fold protein n=1 Tax=Geodermatophilus obscurus (strain ATCC 25078 / DSM 43160 / JCM 3152 / CCUG 61914 / KCC A-0152 / KCTC 9177 / NBRC 13315 / NRRL B-3577 / G-20) TaxID=526225 RepID=D2SH37_GEOOG|nr:alpha/beta hydrolase [Geodermatophilus obscurus]ADB75030.1 alpha/beta hydrolase fold protein [Geodermatophilus obscurus DSM 43160]